MRLQNLSDPALYKLCKEYGLKARLWRRKFAGLLAEVERRKLYRRRGFGSIYEFAAKLGGMSKESVNKVLLLAGKLEDKPILKSLFESGAQGWAKLERVAYVSNSQNEGFWAEKVQTLPSCALSQFVQNYRLENTAGGEIQPEKMTETLEMELKPDLARKLERLKKRPDFEILLEAFVEQVEAKEKAEEPDAVASTSRYIPMRIKQFVSGRTNNLCAYPCCKKVATSLHHTQRWALENIHDPRRLHALCSAHERLAHLGYIENEGESPENWYLKTTPDEFGPKAYVDSLVGLHRPDG